MTTTEVFQGATGETCAACGSDVLVIDLGGSEVVLECDCGPTAVAA